MRQASRQQTWVVITGELEVFEGSQLFQRTFKRRAQSIALCVQLLLTGFETFPALTDTGFDFIFQLGALLYKGVGTCILFQALAPRQLLLVAQPDFPLVQRSCLPGQQLPLLLTLRLPALSRSIQALLLLLT
ncbi:hypothetical protein D3C85_1470200 [compost metagenome]